jgi:Fe-S cluster assembly protein SufB
MSDSMQTLNDHTQSEYKYGWSTPLDMEMLPHGLTEETVRQISAKKEEPEWMLEWRLQAFRHWLTMTEPTWANVHYPKINYQDIIYFAAPRRN